MDLTAFDLKGKVALVTGGAHGMGPGYIATAQTAPLREIQPDGSRHPFDTFICAKTPAGRWGTPRGHGWPLRVPGLPCFRLCQWPDPVR